LTFDGLGGRAPALEYAFAASMLAAEPETAMKNLTESRCPWNES